MIIDRRFIARYAMPTRTSSSTVDESDIA